MTADTIAAMPMKAAIVTAPAGRRSIRRIRGTDAAEDTTIIKQENVGPTGVPVGYINKTRE